MSKFESAQKRVTKQVKMSKKKTICCCHSKLFNSGGKIYIF